MEVQVSVTANDEQEQRFATLTLSSTDGPMVQTMQITQQCLTPDSTTHYRLPVVFHVLYNKEGNKKQNVVEGHLADLIAEVNKLYAQCGVDLRMEFVMATHDPEGNLLEEPGVDRHKINEATLNSSFFMGYGRDPKKYCSYMWDPNRYINIFIYTFEDKGILGISHFPYAIKPHAMGGLDELETNAPWEELPWPQCVSINNEYIYSHEAYYTMTDVVNTLAHELGHFLGLRHAFSEDPETYDRDICLDSDFCTDTPTYNKVAYDKFMQGCMQSGGSIDDNEKQLLLMREDCETGEEFRSTNIMDYAYTEANRFTPQQAARIRYVLEHSPYIPGPKVRLPEQMPATKAARVNEYKLVTFE
jgi:zinc-dependent metalloproteinase lipoprotein